MVLPTPRDKFLQFMQIPPFNRLSNHIDLIGHFLGKMAFFRQHDVAALAYFARKVRLTNKDELDDKFLAIV